MRTIVAGLQPAILATLAIGIPAFSIRETAVCRRSWNRQTKRRDLLFRVRLFRLAFQNPACPSVLAASHASLMLPMGLDGSTSYAFGTELVPSRAVPLCREDVMLRLALREVRCPKAESGHCPLTEGNHAARPGSRLVFAPFQAAILKVHTAPLQRPNHAVPRPGLNRQGDERNQRARAGLSASL